MQFICFTGIRLADVDYAKSEDFKIVPADKTSPRRVVAVLAYTKNDMTGEGPVAGRTFVLPCICLSSLEGTEKTAFAKHLKKDPNFPCSTSCPYDGVVKYLRECPTSNKNAVAAIEKLSFMRALSSRGGAQRVLTVNKLGIVQAKMSLDNVST